MEYHYLGSARILAPIGEAFAEAAVGLLKRREISNEAGR
jgi:hypothetical protein